MTGNTQKDHRVPLEGLVRWISCKDKMPPLPETPFKVYLVWAVVNMPNATGGPYLLQYSRETGQWLDLVSIFGDKCTVTHWSKALDILGAPEPKPFGPRFTLST